MMSIVQWFKERFTNPERAILLLTITFLVVLFLAFGGMLVPVFAAVAIAYLLDGVVKKLKRWKIPHWLAVTIVFLLFIGLIFIALFGLLPPIWKQLTSLFNELPRMVGRGETYLLELQNRYPDFVSIDQFKNLILSFKSEFAKLGKTIVTYSLSTLPGIIEVIVYFVLVPLLVFFFMKDRDIIMTWCGQYLPKRRRLLEKVWYEVNDQIGNYIRAKVFEVIIVGVVNAVVFSLMGLHYALLLGVIVGFSVLVPYIGIIVVTLPVVIIALLQWGMSAHLAYLVLAYSVLAILDGNVLAPLLFSEAVKLHPIAVIVAVLVFGGLWGFWGIFFAIPLATVVKAILNVWTIKT